MDLRTIERSPEETTDLSQVADKFYHLTLEIIMKNNFIQWWSTIPPLSTKHINRLSPQAIEHKKDHENPDSVLWDRHKNVMGVKPVNEIPIICLFLREITVSVMHRWLKPLSTIFWLYRGCQFYWWRKPEYPEKTTDLSQTWSHNVI